MRKQYYILSEYDPTNANQKISPHLILTLILQELGAHKVKIVNDQLSFTLNEKKLIFKFIEGNIAKPESLDILKKNINSPYIYIAKASAILSHSKYLPQVFNKLGHPYFCFVSSARLNPDFSQLMNYWKHNNIWPSREEVLQAQFVSDEQCNFLHQIRHPMLRRLHYAITHIYKIPGEEVTNYHLPTLYR